MDRRNFLLATPALAGLIAAGKPAPAQKPPTPLVHRDLFHEPVTFGAWLQTYCEFDYPYQLYRPDKVVRAKLGLARIDCLTHSGSAFFVEHRDALATGEIVAAYHEAPVHDWAGCDADCPCRTTMRSVVVALGFTAATVFVPRQEAQYSPQTRRVCPQCDNNLVGFEHAYKGKAAFYRCFKCAPLTLS